MAPTLMQDGDISNAVEPRFLVVIEGLLFRLQPEYRRKERLLVAARQWKRAANQWALDSAVVHRLWDLVWRHQYRLDGATWLPEPYAAAMWDRLDAMNIPLAKLHTFRSPEEMAYQLNHMPDVLRVFYAEPRRPFLFGSRGEFVERPEQVQPY